MNSGEITEESALKDLLSSFIDSYTKRDKDIAFSVWLENKLRQEIPDISKEISEKLASEIVEAVADYDNTLNELNKAVDAGQSKEEWFSERMAESYADLPPDIAGERLQLIEDGFIESNLQLMQELDHTQQGQVCTADTVSVEWNEYSLKNKTCEIGKKIGLAGLAVAANAIKYNVQSGKPVGLMDTVAEALQEGLKTEPEEVKAAVAGAVKVLAMRGLADKLPSDTSTEAICDMAGAAVEGAEALFDAANGELTMAEALDKVGRAGVAAACGYGRGALQGLLLCLPGGLLLVDLLGGLLDHLTSAQFIENVYTTIRDAAIATWEGIKESGKRTLHRLENLENIFAD